MTEVGVHHAQHTGRGNRKPRHDRGAESEFAGPMDHAKWVAPCEPIGHITCSVRRIVIDDDQLGCYGVAKEDALRVLDEGLEPVSLVIRRDDDGNVC